MRKSKENCRFWWISCKKWPLFMKTVSLLKFWNELLLFIFPEVCDHEKYCGFLLTNFSVDWLYHVTTVLLGAFRALPESPEKLRLQFCIYLLNSKFTIWPASGFVVNATWGFFVCQFHLFEFFLGCTWWLYWCNFHCFVCLFDICCCWISYFIFCTVC